MFAPTRPLLAALALALASSACSGSTEPACTEQSCPVSQLCQDGTCQPLAPPTATGDLGRFTRVALTSDGRLVVATYDTTNTNLVLRIEQPDGSTRVRVVAGWRFDEHQVVDADAGRWLSLALDADDVVYLAWYDAFLHGLMVGRIPNDGEPVITQVDGGEDNDRGTWTSIAVATDGTVHVAYRDAGAGALRHAWQAPGAQWQHEGVEGCAGEADCPTEAEDYGEYASLVLVANDPRIAFYDRLRGDLKMARRDEGGVWRATTLDGRDPVSGMDTGDVGRFARAALDPKRRVGVAYYDATRGQLRYLPPQPAGAEPVVVDSGVYRDEDLRALRQNPVGQHVALRYDAQGLAHLLYLDAGRLVIRHAAVLGPQVETTEDVEGLPPGGHIDFAVDAQGALRGAYGGFRGDGTIRPRLVPFTLPAAGESP